MASVLDAPTPEQERDRYLSYVRALVMRAGGEVALTLSDFTAANPGLQLQILQRGDSPELTLRMVDPNAPVEGGTYWVRLGPRASWRAALFSDGCFILPQGGKFFAHRVEIAGRIPEPPADKTASSLDQRV